MKNYKEDNIGEIVTTALSGIELEEEKQFCLITLEEDGDEGEIWLKDRDAIIVFLEEMMVEYHNFPLSIEVNFLEEEEMRNMELISREQIENLKEFIF